MTFMGEILMAREHINAISLNGTIITLGSSRKNGNAGYIHVFKLQVLQVSGDWTQLGEEIYGGAGGNFPSSWITQLAAILIIAIGSLKHDGSNGAESGHVCIFQ